MTPAYSIIIPAYNESGRIRPTLDEVLRYSEQQGWNVEIIVVDDGSRDDTTAIIREYNMRHPQIRLIDNPENHGKGFSVRAGMLDARGDLVRHIAGVDCAIGSRWLRTELQTERQPLYRQLFGRIFNLVLRVILGLNFADTQCGFKAFRRDAARRVFPLQRIERWGFDPEILFLARKMGLVVKEVPVVWAHSEGTRLHPFRDGLRMFGDVVRIRWNSISGAYNSEAMTSPGKL